MMRTLLYATLLISSLSGCSGSALPGVDLGGMSLPRFDVFRYGIEDTTIPTMAYTLSPTELTDIKSQFSGAFSDGRTLEFGPISGRQARNSGDIIVCGLVSIHRPDGRNSGMQLFHGVGSQNVSGQRLSFKPQALAGANARTIEVYGKCRDAGLLGAPETQAVAQAAPAPQTAIAAVTVAEAAPLPVLPSSPAAQ